MYLTYDTKTGAICGQSTSEPAAFAGYAHITVPIAVDVATTYVAAGQAKPRVAIDWAAVPADAMVSTNGKAAASGFALPTVPGVWKLAAVGKYRGERTVTIQTLAEIETDLIATVKAEAERRKMLLLSSGGAKKTEYADKYREVAAWDSLGGTVTAILIAFNAMSAATKALRFPYAVASATAFGDTPADAIARFKAGIGRSLSVPTIAAVEEKACVAIKGATTAAAKRAAAAAIWPA